MQKLLRNCPQWEFPIYLAVFIPPKRMNAFGVYWNQHVCMNMSMSVLLCVCQSVCVQNVGNFVLRTRTVLLLFCKTFVDIIHWSCVDQVVQDTVFTFGLVISVYLSSLPVAHLSNTPRRRLPVVVTGDSARIQDETTESSALFCNSLPNEQISDWSQFKAFADDKIKVTEK